MTSTELARRLSDAAIAYRTSADEQVLIELESLASAAILHVAHAGEGTVDHIVLSSVLKLIAADVPSVAHTLEQEGWRWA
jgi:hypothetical protein